MCAGLCRRLRLWSSWLPPFTKGVRGRNDGTPGNTKLLDESKRRSLRKVPLTSRLPIRGGFAFTLGLALVSSRGLCRLSVCLRRRRLRLCSLTPIGFLLCHTTGVSSCGVFSFALTRDVSILTLG